MPVFPFDPATAARLNVTPYLPMVQPLPENLPDYQPKKRPLVTQTAVTPAMGQRYCPTTLNSAESFLHSALSANAPVDGEYRPVPVCQKHRRFWNECVREWHPSH